MTNYDRPISARDRFDCTDLHCRSPEKRTRLPERGTAFFFILRDRALKRRAQMALTD